MLPLGAREPSPRLWLCRHLTACTPRCGGRACRPQDREQRSDEPNPAEHRLSVKGLDLYDEVHGAGEPLVLLHGALSTVGTSFGAVLPSLARTRRVVAIEQQGHGHTADIDRP
jgi:hypothetical protein